MIKSEHISKMLMIAFSGFFISLCCFAVLIYQDLQSLRKNNQQQKDLIEILKSVGILNNELSVITEFLHDNSPTANPEGTSKNIGPCVAVYKSQLKELEKHLSVKDPALFRSFKNLSLQYISIVASRTGETQPAKGHRLPDLKEAEALSRGIKSLISTIERNQQLINSGAGSFDFITKNRTNLFIILCATGSVLMFFMVNFFLLQLSLRKKAEAEQRSKKNEEMFETLFYQSPVMFLMTDAFTSEVINVNNNVLTFLNLSREDIIGKKITRLNLFGSVEDRSILQKIVTDNLPVHDYVTGVCINGKDRHISCNFDTIIIDGKTVLFIAFFDITVQKQAEEAIKESQDHFATLFYKNPSILAFTDIETTRIIDINDKHEEFYGYTRDEVIGRTALELGFYNDDTVGQRIADDYRENSYKKSNLEIEVRTKAGELKHVRFFGETINLKGKKQKLVCLQDITDIKKTEAILKRNEEIYSSLFYKSPVILCISEAETGKFIDVNENYCNFFGFRKNELIGVQSSDLNIWVDYSDRGTLLKQLRGGFNVSNIEMQLRSKSGEAKNIYAHIDLIYLDEKECLICAFVDATQEKEARREILKLNEELEQRVVERTKEIRDYKYALDESAIIVIADNKGAIQHVNNNFTLISQYSFSEVAGRKIELLSNAREKKSGKIIMDTIRQGKVWKGEVEHKAKDKSVFWIHIHIIPFLDTHNRPYQFLIIGWDITQKKIAELQNEQVTHDLMQRNKNLEQYAYIISHNLRAPVSNIMGLTLLLQHKDISEDERLQINKDLYLCVTKLDEVIIDLNSILQSSRQVAESKEEINLSEMIQSIKTSIAQLIDKEQALIECDFKELGNIYSTRSYLNSILYNLISNSIKYRKPDARPEIHIKGLAMGDRAVINYSDNGLGIDLEKYGDKVFGLYKRFHSHKEGKGMGLFMVKTQVETLGGKIDIDSLVGKGSTFTIELPLNK